LNTKQEKLQVN